MLKNYFKKVKKSFKNKKTLKDSFYFLIFFIISFLIVFLLLSKTLIYYLINYFYGSFSSNLLNIFYNIPSTYYYDFIEKATFIIVPTIQYPIAIVFLCTGILEFSLLFSAIVATIGVSFREKIKWALLASLIVVFFNLLRITFTIFIIDSLSLEVADFFHGFLFRAFLIIIVLGTYYLFLKKNFKK